MLACTVGILLVDRDLSNLANISHRDLKLLTVGPLVLCE